MGPYAGVDYNITFCPFQSRLQHISHGQPYARVHPMPEGLWIWPLFALEAGPGSWHYHRGLAQHGVLPSLAGREWPGRCDLYCDGRPVMPSLPDWTVRPARSCSAVSCWHFQLLLSGKWTEPTIMNWEALDVNSSLGWKEGGLLIPGDVFVAGKCVGAILNCFFSSRSRWDEGGCMEERAWASFPVNTLSFPPFETSVSKYEYNTIYRRMNFMLRKRNIRHLRRRLQEVIWMLCKQYLCIVRSYVEKKPEIHFALSTTVLLLFHLSGLFSYTPRIQLKTRRRLKYCLISFSYFRSFVFRYTMTFQCFEKPVNWKRSNAVVTSLVCAFE